MEQQLQNAKTLQGHKLEEILQSISADLDELDDCVQIVLQNKQKFSNISAQEIEDRKKFIQACRQKVHEFKHSQLSSKKQAPLQPKQLEAREKFNENEQMQQQMIMERQDQQMGQVLQTVGKLDYNYLVGNLKEIARVIGDELDDQSR